MKILVITDIHGQMDALERVLSAAAQEKPDMVLCPGDFTDMYSNNAVFSQLDLAEIVVQKLLAFNKNLLCVPGNQDPYDILNIFDEYGVNLHGRIKKRAEVFFAGWGGALTPFNTLFEPAPEETKAALAAIGRKLEGKEFVMLVHNPPKGTKLDLAGGEKHVGSEEVRLFIEESKPQLMVAAHIHESSAVDNLGPSTLFYPGPAMEGFYGVVELGKGFCKCVAKKVKV
jgi:uncharacterized protein